MNLFKIFSTVVILICGISCKFQTAKPSTNGDADSCKDEKITNKSGSTKTILLTDTIAKKKTIACKLTSPELQKRKEKVIASLKAKILDKQELKEGYKYKFEGTDEIFDELSTFIKTERQCCDFFAFTLSISDDIMWLSITGPEGTKDFIKMEMDL